MSDNQDSQKNNNNIPAQESATNTSNQDTKYLMTQTAKDISEPPKNGSLHCSNKSFIKSTVNAPLN